MEIDFGLNWQRFVLDGTTYRHRIESDKYEVQKWEVTYGDNWYYSPTGRWAACTGRWVACKRPKGAPEL